MKSEPQRTASLPEVCEILHCQRSTIYNRIASDPTFPRPFKIGRASVWYVSELQSYVDRCASLRTIERATV